MEIKFTMFNVKKNNKKLRSGTLAIICVFLTALSITQCNISSQGTMSEYMEIKTSDLGYTKETAYDKLVSGIGQDNADQMYLMIGQEEMDLLSYGVGVSNLILLVNIVSDINKVIDLVGSEYPAGSETGLGAIRVVNFLNTVDYWMTQNRYDGALPWDQDTIQRIGDYINGMSLSEISTNVVALIDSMGITRTMDDPGDPDKMDRLCKLISHVVDVNKVILIMTQMTPANIISRMNEVMLGVNDSDRLVEIIDYVSDMGKMVTLLEGVTTSAKLCSLINSITPGNGSKLGYTVENVTSASTIVYLVNNISSEIKMADLINELEDNTTWTEQAGGAQNWDGVPFGGDSGMVRLVGILNGLSTAPNPAKLVAVMDQVTDMTKMMRIIQDIEVNSDMITLISSLADPGVNPEPSLNMGYIIENIGLSVVPRMRMLLDGQRRLGAPLDQPAYLTKLHDLISALDNAQEGPLKVSELIQGVTEINKIINLVYDVNVLANLSQIVNGINKSSTAWPGNTAVVTLVYMIEHLTDITKMVAVIDNVASANVTSLVNNVAAGSQWSDSQATHTQGTVDDEQAAGRKLNNMIDGASDIDDLVFVLNNVSDFFKMAGLVNSLLIASTPKVAVLINNITGSNTWDAANSHLAAGNGKLVNMIENITNLGDVAILIDGITVAQKLSDLINQVINSDLVVSLVNAVIADLNAMTSDLVDLMNGISLTGDIPKMSRLLTDLNGTKDVLVAGMLSDYSSDASQGIGSDEMAVLISSLTDQNAAGAMATLMLNLNPSLSYLGGPVSNREGMVRLIRAGVVYTGVTFPGVGAVHTATMMNIASDPADLSALMNALGVETMVTMTGCGDHVGDPGNDGNPPFDPNFHDPCSLIGLDW